MGAIEEGNLHWTCPRTIGSLEKEKKERVGVYRCVSRSSSILLDNRTRWLNNDFPSFQNRWLACKWRTVPRLFELARLSRSILWRSLDIRLRWFRRRSSFDWSNDSIGSWNRTASNECPTRTDWSCRVGRTECVEHDTCGNRDDRCASDWSEHIADRRRGTGEGEQESMHRSRGISWKKMKWTVMANEDDCSERAMLTWRWTVISANMSALVENGGDERHPTRSMNTNKLKESLSIVDTDIHVLQQSNSFGEIDHRRQHHQWREAQTWHRADLGMASLKNNQRLRSWTLTLDSYCR